MGRRFYHAKDRNHKAVRKAVERLGYVWIDLAQSSAGIDAIVCRGGRCVPIEVKDGSLPPSKQKLTPHEQQVHALLKAHGVTVEILTGDNESLDVLKGDQRQATRNFYRREEK
jgi:hypothetical protein